MMKQILLVATLLIPFSSLQAVGSKKPKSTWTNVKNGAKVFVGAWLTISGLKGLIVYGQMNSDVLARGVREELERIREQQHAQYSSQGLDESHFAGLDTQLEQQSIAMAETLRNVTCVVGVLFSVGGSALIYSGVSGLVQDEEESVN